MANYAIGDVQGCYSDLRRLLDIVHFDPAKDRVWLVGDLINRGPQSLAVLRFVRDLGTAAVSVLGNHDLHFLAIYFGGHSAKRSDTLDELLVASDADELAHWLRQLPLMVSDPIVRFAMCHAGIPHIWSFTQAQAYANEVQHELVHGDYVAFFKQMYGNEPDRWRDDLVGMGRLRLITNYLTRMRLIRRSGRLNFDYKGKLDDLPADWHPWFDLRNAQSEMGLVFGHWASLEGELGEGGVNKAIYALDTGCVWGRTLTCLCLETRRLTRLPSARANANQGRSV